MHVAIAVRAAIGGMSGLSSADRDPVLTLITVRTGVPLPAAKLEALAEYGPLLQRTAATLVAATTLVAAVWIPRLRRRKRRKNGEETSTNGRDMV